MRPEPMVLAATAAAFVLLGCQTKCIDPPDDNMVDLATKSKLQKAVAKDPTFCKALGSPTVSVTALDVVVMGNTEHKVATRASLPANQVARIDPLFNRLRSHRELWKEIHSGGSFPGEVEVTLDPELETARATSVLQTTAFAGYAKFHLMVGSTKIDFDWAVPQSPEMARASERFTITADSSDGKTFDVKLWSSRCGDVTKAKATSAELPASVTKLCAGRSPCADALRIVAPLGGRFADVAKIASDVLAAMPVPKPHLAFGASGEVIPEETALAAQMKAFGLAAADPCKPK
jgi:hypothetical protein